MPGAWFSIYATNYLHTAAACKHETPALRLFITQTFKYHTELVHICSSTTCAIYLCQDSYNILLILSSFFLELRIELSIPGTLAASLS